MHAVNNLAQRPALTAAELDAMADRLAPCTAPLPFVHPHRTWMVGNWDVNVLECALRTLGKDLRWHDQRDADFQLADFASCYGVVVNVQPEGRWQRLLGARHWFSLRRLGAEPGVWLNLDSNLDVPRPVLACSGGMGSAAEQEAALQKYLAQLVAENDAKVFFVIDPPDKSAIPA